jgi:hypothetical protein
VDRDGGEIGSEPLTGATVHRCDVPFLLQSHRVRGSLLITAIGTLILLALLGWINFG